MEEKSYQQFIANIKKTMGIDLFLYKEGQMKRRLTSLFMKRGFESFDQYFWALKQDQHLKQEFLDRITINVSQFFRNKNRWDIFEKNILPPLLNKKESLKVWSAACSSGEEPYTIAMILSKHLPLSKVNIVATDIDDRMLEKAKTGVYSELSLQETSNDMIQKHFTKVEDQFFIHDDIKKCVEFKKHNLLADSFEKQVDFLVCRNVLIYFTEQAKVELYKRFSSSLNKEGILFVGSTEQIFSPSQYDLHTIETFFYQKY
ncbi:protein-glutamate O-methyltransferase CheR [Bacillus carboniphilus]|uniref:protein-glutamate O-methyltransferase n=1 Tax=Bacillus carboniphilus TaxID=86663 RepID=A0ABY9JY84_9BACI|nr:protein-glutamate O-methyltransferase CheR [Bacillus carboniphilus]WLR43739.1 protein-glutamate O-methyltransferase CheR [Bacillus carboniphilus]